MTYSHKWANSFVRFDFRQMLLGTMLLLLLLGCGPRQFYKGDVPFKKGQYDDAIAEYRIEMIQTKNEEERAILRSRLDEALSAGADWYYDDGFQKAEAGNVKGSLASFKKALEYNPEHFAAQIMFEEQTKIFEKSGLLREQIKERLQTLQKEDKPSENEKDWRALLVEIDSYLESYSPDPEIESLREISVRVIFEQDFKQGRLALQNREFETAIEKLETALSLRPGDEVATRLLAEAKEQWAIAQKEERPPYRKPEIVEEVLRKAKAHYKKKEYREALVLVEQVASDLENKKLQKKVQKAQHSYRAKYVRWLDRKARENLKVRPAVAAVYYRLAQSVITGGNPDASKGKKYAKKAEKALKKAKKGSMYSVAMVPLAATEGLDDKEAKKLTAQMLRSLGKTLKGKAFRSQTIRLKKPKKGKTAAGTLDIVLQSYATAIDDKKGTYSLEAKVTLADRATDFAVGPEVVKISGETKVSAKHKQAKIHKALSKDFAKAFETTFKEKIDLSKRYIKLLSVAEGEELLEASVCVIQLQDRHQDAEAVERAKTVIMNWVGLNWDTLQYDPTQLPKADGKKIKPFQPVESLPFPATQP